METLASFKGKVLRISKKCGPKDVNTNGNLTWLYHNHRAFSGNVPIWADWEWPKGEVMNVFRLHFNCLLIGHHPEAGSEACCSLALCRGRKRGPVYRHHYFERANYASNCCYFRKTVKRMYREYVKQGHLDILVSVIDGIVEKPCGVGLFDPLLFDLGLKLNSLHELHRIFTMASVLSWGRFYSLS